MNASLPVANMQPKTPAFPGLVRTVAPSTPIPDVASGVQSTAEYGGATVVAGEVAEVKQEEQIRSVSADAMEPIEIFSDTDSSASESDSEVHSTDDEQVLDAPDEEVADSEDPMFVVKIKNAKTGVVHECKDRFLFDVSPKQLFEAEVRSNQTLCGRLIDEKFELVQRETDWTLRCRVCFKGRRDPNH